MKSKFYTRLTMVLATIFMFTLFASAQTTIEVLVVDGADDAEERLSPDPDPTGSDAIGDISLTSSDLELCTEKDDELQVVGVGFRDVQIPVGATITNAYVQFTSDSDEDAAVSIDIWGVAEANTALPILDASFNLTSRPKTTAMVTGWAPVAWVKLERGANQQTPDLSAIIAEIIAMDGWAPGNNIMIQFTAANTLKEHREGVSYDAAIDPGKDYGADGTHAAALVVTFTEGGGGGGDPISIAIPIIAAADDAEESATDLDGAVPGDVGVGSSDLELGFDKEPSYVGMRFLNVTVPAGATIDNAYVQFTVNAIEPGTTDAVIALKVYGSLEADAAPIVEELFNISGRTPTTAVVDWAPGVSVAVADAGVNEQTPDIAAAVQEIIAVDGWASGNAMMIVVAPGDLAQADDWNREMEAFDGNPDLAPVLNITYAEGGSSRVKSIPLDFASLVYPNPTEGRLYINNPSTANFDYEIYTISGRMVSSKQNNSGSTVEVDMSSFVKGMYFVNVRSEGNSETHKLILK